MKSPIVVPNIVVAVNEVLVLKLVVSEVGEAVVVEVNVPPIVGHVPHVLGHWTFTGEPLMLKPWQKLMYAGQAVSVSTQLDKVDVAHVVPVKPAGQRQVNPPKVVVWQVAPFWHGLLAHALTT